MNKKASLAAILLIMPLAVLFSQDIDFKDKKVLLDGNSILKYERVDALQLSFYSLENDDEVLMYKFFDNGTSLKDDDYYVLNFLTEKKKDRVKGLG